MWNVYNREIASVEAFEDHRKYSKAFKSRVGTTIWTEEALDRYLYLPIKSVPGNYMAYTGVRNDRERM